MASKFSGKSAKSRILSLCTIILLFLSIVYLYLMSSQDNSSSTKHCIAEVASLKYQLDEVTEYKSHVDKMLGECQKSHLADKDKFKDIAEVCDTMKQQSLLCQSQFDDLQGECKKVREIYNREKNETAVFKEKLAEQVKTTEQLQHTVYELHMEVLSLRKSNSNLQRRLIIPSEAGESIILSMDMSDLKKPVNTRNFTGQQLVAPGEYQIRETRLVNGLPPPNLLLDDKVRTKKAEAKSKELTRASDIPPGFAPVLQVVDNSDFINIPPPNLQKNAQDKQSLPKPMVRLAADRDLEIVGAAPEQRGDSLIDQPHPDQDHKLDSVDEHMGNDPHAAVDDDDGGEYGA